MKTGAPLVSIVILNWNSVKYIHQCVEGVLKQSYENIEVVFVDNASSDDSLKECKERYPAFTYIESRSNLGFTGGMNMGIKHSRGEYVLLLNTDVFLREDYVRSCVEIMEANQIITCCSGWEYKWRNFALTDEKVGGALGIRRHLRVTSTNNDDGYVFGVSGSFPVFRMSAVKEIINDRGGFFDETFETGWEDTEMRFYMLYKGFKTVLNKNTIAWHVGSASDNENAGMFDKNLNYQKRIFRNRMYVIDRYIKGFFPLWGLCLSLFDVLLVVFVFLYHNKSMHSYIEAKKEYNMNKLHRKEQKAIVKANCKISKQEILSYVIGI